MISVLASSSLLWLALPALLWKIPALLKRLPSQFSDSFAPLFQTMVSAGDGVILGRTTLMIGATRDRDVRVEELPDGSYQKIPDPV